MEMETDQSIRRNSDGSINYMHYAQVSHRLRSKKIGDSYRKAFRLRVAQLPVVVPVCLLTILLII